MMCILIQPLVANLGEAELTFDDTEHMSDFGAYLCLGAIDRTIFIGELPITLSLLLSEVTSVRCTFTDRIALAGICRISPDPSFFAVQQIIYDHRIVHFRRRGHDAVEWMCNMRSMPIGRRLTP